ncbi:MAG: DNA polymerase III subunit delta [Capsulimonadales bacterium]|nr:DNA polymerase III subunit delta [Capsulimonadales bacterium]
MARSAKAASGKSEPPVTDGEPRVILLTGPETARKNAEALRLIREHSDETFADFDAETMDGNNATADRVLGGVSTVPLGGGKRVVLVRDTQQMDTEEQKRLAQALGKIPASGFLILHTGLPIVEEGKVRKQSVVLTELANAVRKSGIVLDFALPKAEDLRAYLIAEARALGKQLSSDAVTLLSQLPADDVGRVRSEMEKAAAHAGDAPTITGADVEAVLTRGADDVIFKLCDAVGMRQPQEALGHVATLFRSGQKPEAVAPRTLVLLARQMRLIAQFRYLGEMRMAGRNAGPVTPEVLALLPADGAGGILNNPRTRWMADKYVNQARKFSSAELAYRMERLLAADLALKGAEPGGDNPQAVLQRLVTELC